MKKLIAMLLVLTLAMGLIACGNNNDENPTTEAVNVPASALEILETVWNGIPEESRFFAMGGDMNNMVDNAPGNYALTDEGITGTLLVPAEQVANLDQAASLVHGMNLNTFTCGAYHIAQGGDATAFADEMYNTISNNQWMCGFPDKLLIAVIAEQYVVVVFGGNDAMALFETSFNAAYADADVKYNEAIAA